MSLQACSKLGLDQVWWLVSPQNPLKSQTNMASLPHRLAKARDITAPYSFIHVVAPEASFFKTTGGGFLGFFLTILRFFSH